MTPLMASLAVRLRPLRPLAVPVLVGSFVGQAAGHLVAPLMLVAWAVSSWAVTRLGIEAIGVRGKGS